MPVPTKLGSMVTYNEEHSPIMLHDPLFTWSNENT